MRMWRLIVGVGLGFGFSAAASGVEVPARYVNPYYSATSAGVQPAAPRNLPAHPMTALGHAVRVEKLTEAYHATNEYRPRTQSKTKSNTAAPQMLTVDPHAKPLIADTRAPTLMQTLRRDAQVVTAAYTVAAPPVTHAAQPLPTCVPATNAAPNYHAAKVESPNEANPLRRAEGTGSRAATNPLRAE